MSNPTSFPDNPVNPASPQQSGDSAERQPATAADSTSKGEYREHHSEHHHSAPGSSHHHHRRHHRHHRKKWPWVVGILAGVIVIIAAIAGVCGTQLLKQAQQVKSHEMKALDLLGPISGDVSKESLEQLRTNLPQVQQETAQARAIANGGVWKFAAAVPGVGKDVTTVRGMTATLDEMTHDSLPAFLDVLDSLEHAQIAGANDGINLQPIVDCANALKDANDLLQSQVNDYNALPTPGIRQLKQAYTQGRDKLDSFAGQVDTLSNTFLMLPGFLGQDGPQTYAVLAVTPSEMRSGGGLVGSVGQIRTDHGAMEVGEFTPNGRYLKYGIGDHSDDYKRIFSDEGPLVMSFDIRDLAVFPNTADTAVAMRSIWDRTPWGKDDPLNGIVMIDPVFVQQLIAITGNVTLDDGTVLTGENTAEYLLNTIYKEKPIDQTDAVFAEVAAKTMPRMFTGMDTAKLMTIGKMMGQMAAERHVAMYSFNEQVEASMKAAGFTGSVPDSEENPAVGVYITEQNPSKLGWYIQRSAKVSTVDCNRNEGITYHVEYTLKNTLTQQEVDSLPQYITGDWRDQAGNSIEKILFYPPQGGRISNIVELNGAANAVKKDTLDGDSIYRTTVTVKPGQSVTYSFDVTVSDKAKAPLRIDQTPLGKSGEDVEYSGATCSAPSSAGK